MSYDWRKGIQLLRHAKSRKRSCLFPDKKYEEKQSDAREEEDVAEILCAAQMKELLGVKSNTRMDGHLKDVKIQQRKLFDIMGDRPSKVKPIPENTFTTSSCRKLLANIEKKAEKLEKKRVKMFRRSNSDLCKSFDVDKEKFFKGFLPDQRAAGEYLLKKIRTLTNDDQLLMLLHGQPGSGKTFFVERLRDYTNLRMKISASSGLTGMSLGGTTLDYLMGFGHRSGCTSDWLHLQQGLKKSSY